MTNNEENVELEEDIIEEEENTESTGKVEIVEETNEVDELNQRLLRVSADFDNFKRRTREEKASILKYANEKLLIDTLPVLDNFQRAIDVKEPSEEVKKFIEGMDMIYRQLYEVLKKSGLSAIEAKGNEFNPELHDAVMQVENNEVPDNTVIEDLRAGYLYHDKVIRPSMVQVAKNS
ncbi:molecular chaperone GrpE [Desulfonispora thiosulfatigenes DSM 11270]|uniref:Protein GrpE n=1 Tax=Desulfonispora thiosulfatigenes DSM 11270 TaxID=656914 RepID=A0A1W1VC02_DESTI|nr:nucleotide exchange factor GrpE [Desulfonispora thiosulfatigenes]SMB90888.1 molecular chaperone GrpE [Desulfonispora thiosulfatigenes DSM 11270]